MGLVSAATKKRKVPDVKKIQELEALIQTISRGKYMWESTFDAIANPVMIVSSDFRILRANRAAAKASGADVRDLVGTHCYESLAGSHVPCRNCPLPSTLKSKEPNIATLDPFKKSAKEFQANAYPLEEKGEAVLYYREITEEKKLQRQLLQSEKMAAIGMLAGGVAHEINNPLGGILAFAQLAMRELEKSSPVQEDLKEIEGAALRCKRIVQDLLDFSRQNPDEEIGPVLINTVFDKLKPLIEVQARASRVQVIYELAEDLKPMRGNIHKLQQVFLNLITNAYQAMEQGGRLTIRTFMKKNEIKAQVKDTGPGIAKEIAERIFDPYFTTKAQGQGTGLGLAITYGIVQEHGGIIEIESAPGRGATFELTFPAMVL